MDTSWSAADVHRRAMDGYVGGMPASWSAVGGHNQVTGSIERRQQPGSGGMRSNSQPPAASSGCAGGSEDILAQARALRQQWGTVKNDTVFNAMAKLSGVTPDASTYAPDVSGGNGAAGDLSSTLSLLQATTDIPDLETFKRNSLTMPDLETFKQQLFGRTSGGAGQAGPTKLQGAADPPRPWAHASASQGVAGQICFGGSSAFTGGGGAPALQGDPPREPGQLPEAAKDVRDRLQEAERALDERTAQANTLLNTSQELLALVKSLQDRPAQPSESMSQWQRDVVSRAELAIRQATPGSGGPGVRPAAAVGTLTFATDRAGWPSSTTDHGAAGTSPWAWARPTSPCAGRLGGLEAPPASMAILQRPSLSF